MADWRNPPRHVIPAARAFTVARSREFTRDHASCREFSRHLNSQNQFCPMLPFILTRNVDNGCLRRPLLVRVVNADGDSLLRGRLEPPLMLGEVSRRLCAGTEAGTEPKLDPEPEPSASGSRSEHNSLLASVGASGMLLYKPSVPPRHSTNV